MYRARTRDILRTDESGRTTRRVCHFPPAGGRSTALPGQTSISGETDVGWVETRDDGTVGWDAEYDLEDF